MAADSSHSLHEKAQPKDDRSSRYIRQAVTDLIEANKVFVHQLVNGCGDRDCRNNLCHNGRCNTSDAPVRRYSPRTASILSQALLLQHNLTTILCPAHYSTQPSSIPSLSNAATPRDPTSLSQCIADSIEANGYVAIQSTNRHMAGGKTLRRALEKLKIPPFQSSGGRTNTFLGNESALYYMKTVFDHLTGPVSEISAIINPLQRCSDHAWQRYEWFLNHEHSIVPTNLYTRSRKDSITALQLFEKLKNSPDFDVVKKLCEVTAYRFALEDVKSVPTGCGDQSLHSLLEAMIIDPHLARELRIWFKLAFYTCWNRNPVIDKSSIARGALELLTHLRIGDGDGTDERWTMTAVQDELEIRHVIKTYLAAGQSRSTATVHILDYAWLFKNWTRMVYMKRIAYQRMLHAQQTVEASRRVWQEGATFFVDHSDISVRSHEQIWDSYKDITQEFLLLTINREHVLEDAMKQLWRLRRGELLKPLRVRIREMDGVDIGQDQGGVQVEFFSILLQQMFQQDYGLFKTIEESGMTYFNVGSSQPLHVYQYLGILFALALHNGIRLPIQIPSVFYCHLGMLDASFETRIASLSTTKCIERGWPDQARSLQQILELDVTDMGLTYSMSVESNGATYVVVPPSTDSNVADDAGRMSLYFDPQITEPSAATPHWPGWRITKEEIVREITNDNKLEFVAWYISRLTTASIWPQLEAFLTGFRCVFSERLLAVVSPEILQQLLEGIVEVDTAKIRKHAWYENFEAEEPYIEDFWAMFEAWPQDRRRGLLRFVTASDRMPPVGTGHVKLRIELAPGGDDRLPTSSTCYHKLNLPRYSSKAVMQERLEKAIDFGEYGFGTI